MMFCMYLFCKNRQSYLNFFPVSSSSSCQKLSACKALELQVTLRDSSKGIGRELTPVPQLSCLVTRPWIPANLHAEGLSLCPRCASCCLFEIDPSLSLLHLLGREENLLVRAPTCHCSSQCLLCLGFVSFCLQISSQMANLQWNPCGHCTYILIIFFFGWLEHKPFSHMRNLEVKRIGERV